MIQGVTFDIISLFDGRYLFGIDGECSFSFDPVVRGTAKHYGQMQLWHDMSVEVFPAGYAYTYSIPI